MAPSTIPKSFEWTASFAFPSLDWHGFSTVKTVLATLSLLLLSQLVKTIYAGLTNSLRKIPGPLLNRFSYWPLKLATISGRRVHYVHDLHTRYGSCVLISPEEVAISDLAAVKEIHRIGSGFLKAPWYGKFTQEKLEDHEKGIFAIQEPKTHAARRKLFANGFSKTALTEWEDVLQEKVDLTMEGLKKDLQSKGTANILAWFTFMANDVIATLSFGKSFEALENGQKTQFIRDLESVMMFSGMMVELPVLSPILKRIQPRERLNQAGKNAIAASQKREGQGLGYRNTIFTKMMNAGQEKALSQAQIEQEASNLIVAGSDTTAVSLTYLVYAVLADQDQSIRQRLIEETGSLSAGFTAADAAELPYLSKVIQETLRLYGAAPGSLPRTVPAGGRMLAGHYIPGGTTVSTQAYTNHRSASVFPDPLKFNPNRWDSPTQQMKDAYMPFGGGTRVCIGLHLASMELALAAARFFREFSEAKLAADATPASMEFENFFLIAPKSHQCNITL